MQRKIPGFSENGVRAMLEMVATLPRGMCASIDDVRDSRTLSAKISRNIKRVDAAEKKYGRAQQPGAGLDSQKRAAGFGDDALAYTGQILSPSGDADGTSTARSLDAQLQALMDRLGQRYGPNFNNVFIDREPPGVSNVEASAQAHELLQNARANLRVGRLAYAKYFMMMAYISYQRQTVQLDVMTDFESALSTLVEQGFDITPETWDEWYACAEVALQFLKEKITIFYQSSLVLDAYAATRQPVPNPLPTERVPRSIGYLDAIVTLLEVFNGYFVKLNDPEITVEVINEAERAWGDFWKSLPRQHRSVNDFMKELLKTKKASLADDISEETESLLAQLREIKTLAQRDLDAVSGKVLTEAEDKIKAKLYGGAINSLNTLAKMATTESAHSLSDQIDELKAELARLERTDCKVCGSVEG